MKCMEMYHPPPDTLQSAGVHMVQITVYAWHSGCNGQDEASSASLKLWSFACWFGRFFAISQSNIYLLHACRDPTSFRSSFENGVM